MFIEGLIEDDTYMGAIYPQEFGSQVPNLLITGTTGGVHLKNMDIASGEGEANVRGFGKSTHVLYFLRRRRGGARERLWGASSSGNRKGKRHRGLRKLPLIGFHPQRFPFVS